MPCFTPSASYAVSSCRAFSASLSSHMVCLALFALHCPKALHWDGQEAVLSWVSQLQGTVWVHALIGLLATAKKKAAPLTVRFSEMLPSGLFHLAFVLGYGNEKIVKAAEMTWMLIMWNCNIPCSGCHAVHNLPVATA